MQNVAEKNLPIYLLMSNCGSRRDVDNKPSVSETFKKKCVQEMYSQGMGSENTGA